MVVGELSAVLASRVIRREITDTRIEDILLDRLEYLDEDRWCADLARALGLPLLAFKKIDNPNVPLRIVIDGVDEPLTDPRVLQVATRAMRFGKIDRMGIEAGGWTAILRVGQPASAWPDGDRRSAVRSDLPITQERLSAVERQGGTVRDLLEARAAES